MKHAYYPNWNLRLFRRAKGRFEKISEAETRSGDVEIHEHVVITGTTGRLSCEMDHYPYPSIESFVEKHNRYSNWEARGRTGHDAGRERVGNRRGARGPAAEAQAMVAPAAVPAMGAVFVRLCVAEGIPRWTRGVLFCAAARVLRIPVRGQRL